MQGVFYSANTQGTNSSIESMVREALDRGTLALETEALIYQILKQQHDNQQNDQQNDRMLAILKDAIADQSITIV